MYLAYLNLIELFYSVKIFTDKHTTSLWTPHSKDLKGFLKTDEKYRQTQVYVKYMLCYYNTTHKKNLH